MPGASGGPIHLRPAAPLAPRVLLPGDPGRALTIAQGLLERPRMFNHRRGLWGYTGLAADGWPVTVQSTGMGGPSAAIVVHELLSLGAEVLIRTGTCGALVPGLGAGALVTVTEAIAADGASSALGSTRRAAADPALVAALLATEAATPVVAASTDLFYEDREGLEDGWRREGARVVEMETATIFRLALRHGARSAAVLAVSDPLGDSGERFRGEAEEGEEVGLRLGAAALAALGTGPVGD